MGAISVLVVTIIAGWDSAVGRWGVEVARGGEKKGGCLTVVVLSLYH